MSFGFKSVRTQPRTHHSEPRTPPSIFIDIVRQLVPVLVAPRKVGLQELPDPGDEALGERSPAEGFLHFDGRRLPEVVPAPVVDRRVAEDLELPDARRDVEENAVVLGSPGHPELL